MNEFEAWTYTYTKRTIKYSTRRHHLEIYKMLLVQNNTG